jgi:internalin A
MAKRIHQAPPREPSGAGPANRAAFQNPFDDRVLLAYYEQVFYWHGFVRFLGLPHLRDNPDVPIWQLFVEPLLAEQHVSPDRPL